MELPERYLDISANPKNPFISAILFFSVFGLSLTLFVVVVFIKFNGNKVVRAYGRDLCYMILTGIAILFISPFPFLVKPATTACIFRASLSGIAFLTCYAPLFLKVSRIYRIYLHAQKSPTMPKLLNSEFLLLCAFGIIAIQFLLFGVWFALKMPTPHSVVHRNQDMLSLLVMENPVQL